MTDPTPLLIHDTEPGAGGHTACRIRDGRITELGTRLAPEPDETVIDARGGALVPGLADHHLHLAALAAHAVSVDLGGADTDLVTALRGARPDGSGWLRVVGYDDTLHGALDRTVLDEVRDDVPVRVQHRSGALWVLNSSALAEVGASGDTPAGVERDDRDVPTGRVWRADDWLRRRLPASAPDLRAVSEQFARYGITHVTDATPGSGALDLLADAVMAGDVSQHVTVMSDDRRSPTPRVRVGPLKLVAADHALPDLDELAVSIAAAHAAGRPVAVHCVTRATLAITLAALDIAGTLDGDRIEHAAVCDPATAHELAARGLRVATQPGMIARRGDRYRAEVEPVDLPHLWPLASLLAAGVRTVISSDAPYASADPWAAIRAAVDRRAPSGAVLNVDEGIDARTALAGLWCDPDDIGGPPRQVAVGAGADVVLLDRPLDQVLASPSADAVRLTVIGGRVAFDAFSASGGSPSRSSPRRSS